MVWCTGQSDRKEPVIASKPGVAQLDCGVVPAEGGWIRGVGYVSGKSPRASDYLKSEVRRESEERRKPGEIKGST
jgi:hypothetical protein